MTPARLRAGIVLLEGDRLALIERTRGPELYYVLPGGMVDHGESPVQAAKRESAEELGLEVDIGPLVAEVTVVRAGNVARQLYFRATTVGGVFGTGTGEEFALALEAEQGIYKAVWRTMRECRVLDVRPRVLVDVIAAGGIERLCESPLTVREEKQA